MKSRFVSCLLATAVASTFAAMATSAAAANVDLNVSVGPPAPRYEAVPAPRAGYVWTPGYWDWRTGRHVWVGGRWARERPGYAYARPEWVNEGGHWNLHRGEWRPNGDRDHDGVPNRFDRHPRDPNRP